MGTGFSKKKKQMKAMQEQFSRMQEELSSVEAEGTSGGGMVTIKINGDHEITDLKIKPDCVDPDDVEGLEDLIKVAFSNASEALKEKMPSAPGDLGGLAGLGGLGF